MDLDAAKTLLARSAAAGEQQRFLWGRWTGSALHLEDDPDTAIEAGNVVNAAGYLMPGQMVLCLVETRPHRITIIGPPGQASYGTTGRGSWWRSPDGMQICWIHTTGVRADTARYGGLLWQSRWEWTYPMPFVGQPAVSCGVWQWSTGASWGGVSGSPGAASCLLRGWDAVPRTVADPLTISATAIGRWRA